MQMIEKRKVGRPPKTTETPKPVSLRFKTQQLRDAYLEMGGARWANREAQEYLDSPKSRMKLLKERFV